MNDKIVPSTTESSDDAAALHQLGYGSSLERGYSTFHAVAFAFTIAGVSGSIVMTYDVVLALGGPAAALNGWIWGSVMCLFLGASVAELVSAYPSDGGMNTVAAWIYPRYCSRSIAYLTAMLNVAGQIAGVASLMYGLARCILAAIVIARQGDFAMTPARLIGIHAAVGVLAGLMNSASTHRLASTTWIFLGVNLTAFFAIVIGLSVTTPDKHSGSYIFGELFNNTGYSNNFLPLAFGLLIPAFILTDYDATGHIAEEIKGAARAAPIAIIIAIAATGVFGSVLIGVLNMCLGDVASLPGLTGLSVATLLEDNIGRGGTLAIWPFVCMTLFATICCAMQAASRSVFALGRDRALHSVFARTTSRHPRPLVALWSVVLICILIGLVAFIGPVVINAVFAVCALGIDLSYVPGFIGRLFFANHPDVAFRPGQFNLGRYSKFVHCVSTLWILFECCILALPNVIPPTWSNFNYSAPVVAIVLLSAAAAYLLVGRQHYNGPPIPLHIVLGSTASLSSVDKL